MDNKKRHGIQAVATLLQNANFKGFFTGKIYKGGIKNTCVPGLNCYSCPGAVGSCPIGSLQNQLSAYSLKIPYYVIGLLIFFGAVFGRIICGFLCPFGFLQDLLDKIQQKKKIKSFKGDLLLRKLKYIILIFFVIILPLFVKITPFFCKYICPQGTLSGILLAICDNELISLFGTQFMFKFCILSIIIILSIFIYRPFCKYLCPLGAFYGLFNKYALIKMNVDTDKCTKCGQCVAVCDMGCSPIKNINSAECIRCGKCIDKCKQNAIKYTIYDK